MAAKCANTKPGAKISETWSGDDITRELTSCFNKTGITLSTFYAGVTTRIEPMHVDRIFDDICKLTRPDISGTAIILSNDVSGWITQAPKTLSIGHI